MRSALSFLEVGQGALLFVGLLVLVVGLGVLGIDGTPARIKDGAARDLKLDALFRALFRLLFRALFRLLFRLLCRLLFILLVVLLVVLLFRLLFPLIRFIIP